MDIILNSLIVLWVITFWVFIVIGIVATMEGIGIIILAIVLIFSPHSFDSDYFVPKYDMGLFVEGESFSFTGCEVDDPDISFIEDRFYTLQNHDDYKVEGKTIWSHCKGSVMKQLPSQKSIYMVLDGNKSKSCLVVEDYFWEGAELKCFFPKEMDKEIAV